jgi:hypothetical protein
MEGAGLREWPDWWGWDLELSAHLLKRMEERGFTEIDLRRMLGNAVALVRDIEAGRWVISTRRRRSEWEVIVEPDPDRAVLVVITAYATEKQ